MLFNTVESSAKLPNTDVAKNSVVQSCQKVKIRSHINHLTAFNLFIRNNFKCIMNRGIKSTFHLKLFTASIKSEINCNIHLCFNSIPSSLDGIWWIAVRTVFSSKYSRFYMHVVSVLLLFLLREQCSIIIFLMISQLWFKLRLCNYSF